MDDDAPLYLISFELTRLSKSDLNVLKDHDCTRKDAIRRRVAEAILEKLTRFYELRRRPDAGVRWH